MIGGVFIVLFWYVFCNYILQETSSCYMFLIEMFCQLLVFFLFFCSIILFCLSVHRPSHRMISPVKQI